MKIHLSPSTVRRVSQMPTTKEKKKVFCSVGSLLGEFWGLLGAKLYGRTYCCVTVSVCMCGVVRMWDSILTREYATTVIILLL